MRWLGRVAAERPIVLVLEDLHVADAATRAFATFLSRIAREERLSLVLTWQPDRLTRDHPLRANLAVIEAGLRRRSAWISRRSTRREIGQPDRGDRGRAAVGVGRRPRRRAVGRDPAGDRGADRRPARAQARQSDRDAGRPRRRPAGSPVARVPAGPAAARAVAAADGARPPGRRRGRVRGGAGDRERRLEPPAAIDVPAAPCRRRARRGPRRGPRRGDRARVRSRARPTGGSRSATSSSRGPS